jgi:hypothetical protein
MKRPSIVWAYTIIVLIGMFFSIYGSIINLNNPPLIGAYTQPKFISIISIVLIVPYLIFLILFFMLKRSSLIWLYISFGLFIILNLISALWIWLIIDIVFGWVVWDYIRNKKVDNAQVFT